MKLMIAYGKSKIKSSQRCCFRNTYLLNLKKREKLIGRTYKQKVVNINWSVSKNIFFCYRKTQFIKEFIFDFESVFDTKEKEVKI